MPLQGLLNPVPPAAMWRRRRRSLTLLLLLLHAIGLSRNTSLWLAPAAATIPLGQVRDLHVLVVRTAFSQTVQSPTTISVVVRTKRTRKATTTRPRPPRYTRLHYAVVIEGTVRPGALLAVSTGDL